MLLFVSKPFRIADEAHELLDTMGTVLDKSLPGQLSELRQQVVPGVPTRTLHKSTNLIMHDHDS